MAIKSCRFISKRREKRYKKGRLFGKGIGRGLFGAGIGLVGLAIGMKAIDSV